MQLWLLSWQDITALVVAFALWKSLVYFTRKSALSHLKGPPGGNVLYGHVRAIFDINKGIDYIERLSNEFGGVVRVKGILGEDTLWISDSRALEQMLLKAPAAWEASELFTNLTNMLFGPGLMASSGKQHKKQRRLLNPMFSGSRMSNIVPLFYSIGHQLKENLLQEIGSDPKELDILEWMGRATMEFIGQGSLGYRLDAFGGHQNEYRDAMRRLMPGMAQLGVLADIAIILSATGPPWFRRLIVDLIPISAVQDFKHVVDTMHKSSTKIFQDRKMCVAQDPAVDNGREDLLSLLVRVNTTSATEDRLSDQEAIAQLGTMMFAANDSTASALSRVFELLASHPDIQTKLREELEHANADVGLDYDQLMSLPLLDAVCKETLRLHPPVPVMTRRCQQDDILPLLQPIESKSGRTVTEIMTPKGTFVFVDIRSANRSKSVWGSNAHEWVPERWSTSGPAMGTRLPGAFSSMMTFMGGERSCIGYKMAFLELKIVLSVLLPTFRFELGSEDVVWHLGATIAPFVQGQDGAPDRGPELPLRLSRVGTS